MTATPSCDTDCHVTGLVLVCFRDGRKVFRPYLPTQDANNYARSGIDVSSDGPIPAAVTSLTK